VLEEDQRLFGCLSTPVVVPEPLERKLVGAVGTQDAVEVVSSLLKSRVGIFSRSLILCRLATISVV
jgi:hypothetical protein